MTCLQWPRRTVATLAIAALAAPGAAHATDLLEAWHAAQAHDLDIAVAQAARQAGATRRDQAGALWRPTVVLTGLVGVAGSDTSVSGAQFSAPGLGTSSGVGFNTSINRGALGRWAVSASLPLLNRERDAQGRQLGLAADAAELEWQLAQQALMLTTAQRYFDVVLADESLRVLRQQQTAVGKALAEAQERFRLGDVPITDTHEARARNEGIAAQVGALESDLQLKQAVFADATGLTLPADALRAPAEAPTPADDAALATWLAEADAHNLQLRLQSLAAEVARAEAAKSHGALSPSVDLMAQVGGERLSGSGDFGHASNASSNRMVGVQLSVPLYTGGMRQAREQEALRGVDKAEAQLARARQQVAQQTRAAWLGLTVGRSRITALGQALAASRARLDSTRLGRQVGHRTTLDLLNAENDAASADLALLQARIEWSMNRLRLAVVAGRVDEATLQAVNEQLLATH